MALKRFFILAVLLLLVVGVRALADAVGLVTSLEQLEVASPLALGVVLLAAHLAGAVASDLGLPRVTGYIIGGLIVGPSALHIVSDADVAQLSFVDDVAIALIAFSAGAELRLPEVRAQGRAIAGILVFGSLIGFIAIAGLIFAFSSVIPITQGRSTLDVLVIAAVFGSIAIANSPSVAVAVINDTRSKGPVSSTILGVTVLKDVVVILLFAVMLAVAQAALQGGGGGSELVPKLSWEIGGSIGLGLLVGWLVTQWMRRFSGQPILFVLGMAVALAGISEMLHTEVLLMALAAGFFVENVSHVEAEPFIHAVEANSVPFYALFFALAGAGIHLDALTEVWYFVLILVAVRAAAFWFGTRLGARVGHAPEAVQKYAWTGFISQAGVTLGMVTIAAEAFPAWGEEMKLLIVAMVAVHELVGPVILQKGLEASGETQQAIWPEDAEDRKAKAAAVTA